MKPIYIFGKMRFTGGKKLYRITGWNVKSLIDRAVFLVGIGDDIYAPLSNAGLSGFQVIMEEKESKS